MNETLVVERNAVASEEEKRIRESLKSICASLPSSNSSQLKAVSESFDQLVVPFLEKPHLLDPIVKEYINVLIEYVKDFVIAYHNENKTRINCVFTVLYSIVRVRGRKVAVAYFPNDVFLLSPFLHFLKSYDESDLSLWKSHFMLLFWISLLLLSPFDLSTIQEENEDMASDLYSLSLLYMTRVDCVGEIASEMLSLFLSRKDIALTYLQPTLELILSQLDDHCSSLYCNLLCLTAFLKYAHEEEMRVVIDLMIESFIPKCEALVDSPAVHFKTRILLMKIVSQLCIHRLQLIYTDHGILVGNQKWSSIKAQDSIDLSDAILDFLSNCVSLLLSQLQENSILLREKVSNYIAKIAVFLPTDFCQSVLNELLSLMEESNSIETLHGCCYSVAAMLSRHLITIDDLPSVLSTTSKFVLYQIEKNTASTTSIIRDSACYMLWSLVRGYPSSVYANDITAVLPLLVRLSITDKEINTRRAASAVIQEIVGRVGADHIPAGIDLINLLNYNSLAQLQNIYSSVIPQLAHIPGYDLLVVEHMKWFVDHQENVSMTEQASKSVFYLAQSHPNLVDSVLLIPLLTSDWTSIPYRVVCGVLMMVASCLKGYSIIHHTVPPSLITKMIDQFHQLLNRSFTTRQSSQIRTYELSFLQAITYHSDDFYSLFTSLFSESHSWPTRSIQYSQEESCLLVCSQWFYQHHHSQGIAFCTSLVNQALQNPTEYSVHLYGSIFWKISPDSIDLAITLLKKRLDPGVLECLAIVISRLLSVQPIDDAWLRRLTSWFDACCSCYVRDTRGDVGSWTRIAGITGLELLLDKLILSFPVGWTHSLSTCSHLKGINEYIVTNYGIATILDNSFITYLPLTEGSTLYPSSSTVFESIQIAPASFSLLKESVVESITKPLLKQMAEQHSVIRDHAHHILVFLHNLQSYETPFLKDLMSYPMTDESSIIEQLIYYLQYEELADIVLQGFIFLIGGNTPGVTEEGTSHFLSYLNESHNQRIIPSLLKIMKNEFVKGNNGFYPALKTFVICLEVVDIMDSMSTEELNDVPELIVKASIRYKSRVAVLKLLLELLQVISVSIGTTKELISLFIPFLSCSFSHIREEASQILYLTLSMKETPEEHDEEIIQIIGDGQFTGDSYKEAIQQLQSIPL